MLKTCSRGHKFEKTSMCPICPICWPGYKKKFQSDFPEKLPSPALGALVNAKITKLSQLTKFTEKRIASLHGMGPKALNELKISLKKHGLSFAEEKLTGKHTEYHKDGSV